MKPLSDPSQSTGFSTSGRESAADNDPDPDHRAKVLVAEGCGHEQAFDWHAAVGCYRESSSRSGATMFRECSGSGFHGGQPLLNFPLAHLAQDRDLGDLILAGFRSA
jgi:hypothetical protein